MTMLEEFEAWATNDDQYGISRFYTDLRYDDDETEAAWDAWQASRSSLVIKLPEKWGEYTKEGSAACDAIDECQDNIHAAGVRTL